MINWDDICVVTLGDGGHAIFDGQHPGDDLIPKFSCVGIRELDDQEEVGSEVPVPGEGSIEDMEPILLIESTNPESFAVLEDAARRARKFLEPDSYDIKDKLDNIRRAAERGRDLALDSDSSLVDAFQHILDELER